LRSVRPCRRRFRFHLPRCCVRMLSLDPRPGARHRPEGAAAKSLDYKRDLTLAGPREPSAPRNRGVANTARTAVQQNGPIRAGASGARLRAIRRTRQNTFVSATLSRPEVVMGFSPEGDGAPRGASPPVRGELYAPDRRGVKAAQRRRPGVPGANREHPAPLGAPPRPFRPEGSSRAQPSGRRLRRARPGGRSTRLFRIRRPG
jgi:hypothetical protein